MLPGGGDTRPSAKLSCPTSRSTICNPSESIFQNESREESCGNRKVTGIVQRSPISRHYVAGITQLRLGGGGSFGRLGSECGTGAGGTVTRDQPDSDIEGEI